MDACLREIHLDAVAGFALPWIETLDVTTDAPVDIANVDDDLSRELSFYQQALSAAKEGRRRLLQAGTPFHRPRDYFAEMVKSDEHMMRIRKRLLDETQSIQKSEDAKRQRDLKKYGKQVQVQKLQERQAQKAKELSKMDQWKKRKRSQGEEQTTVGGGEEEEFDIDAVLDERPQKQARSFSSGAPQKRAQKNAKYGFGGKKRDAKKNSAESTNDFQFDHRRNKQAAFSGAAGGKGKSAASGGKKKGAPRRLGKDKRMRTKK